MWIVDPLSNPLLTLKERIFSRKIRSINLRVLIEKSLIKGGLCSNYDFFFLNGSKNPGTVPARVDWKREG